MFKQQNMRLNVFGNILQLLENHTKNMTDLIPNRNEAPISLGGATFLAFYDANGKQG